MTYALIFYWVVAGLALFIWLPREKESVEFHLVMSMMLGGIAIPALAIAKVLK